MTLVAGVSIIAGLNTYVETKLTNLNPDVLVFTKYGIIRSRAEFIMANRRKALTMRETRLVAEECRSCAAVGAQAGQTGTVHAGNRKLAGGQGGGRGQRRPPRRRQAPVPPPRARRGRRHRGPRRPGAGGGGGEEGTDR